METFGGYDSWMLYAYYEQAAIILTIWVFETEDGVLHYAALEGPEDGFWPIQQRTSESFSLVK